MIVPTLKNGQQIINKIIEEESLGGLESFYIAIQKGFLSPRTYYIGCTNSFLIIVRINALNLEPWGKTEIVQWEQVEVQKIKNLPEQMKQINFNFMGNKYKIRASINAKGWNNDMPRFENFIASFENRMKK